MQKNKIMAALVAIVLAGVPASAKAENVGIWTGVDFGPDSYFAYLGGVAGIMGQDISTQSGFLARIAGGYGQYDYNTVAVVGGNVDGDVAQGDLMIGYRSVFPSGNLSVFVGGEYQNHDQSPRDLGNSVDGSEGGVKGLAELSLNLVSQLDFNGIGSYSTAFDSYWSLATLGWNFGPVTIGPEVRFLGNEEFDQIRYGGQAGNIDLGFANVSIYGGYASTRGRGDDGAYGGIGFGKRF